MPKLVWIALLMTLPLSGGVGAQVADSLLAPGARVRVWTRTRSFVAREGRVQARQGDSLDLRLRYPLNDMRTGTEYARLTLFQLDSAQVNVKTGWTARRSSNYGVAVGAMAGAVLGLIAMASPTDCFAIGTAQNSSTDYSCPPRITVQEFILDSMVSSAIGAIIGGTVGAVFGKWKSERWTAVRLPGR